MEGKTTRKIHLWSSDQTRVWWQHSWKKSARGCRGIFLRIREGLLQTAESLNVKESPKIRWLAVATFLPLSVSFFGIFLPDSFYFCFHSSKARKEHIV